MNWTDDDVETARMAWAASGSANYCPTRAEVEALMSSAVEIIRARGGTMTAEDLESRLAVLASDGWGRWIDAFRQHLAAQGATVAKLQNEVATAIEDRDALYAEKVGFLRAKQEAEAQRRRAEEAHGKTLLEVATLRVRVDACEAALMDAETDGAMWEAEAQRARAEVERLKADLERLSKSGESLHAEAAGLEQRAESAESRLAAVRERAGDEDGIRRAVRADFDRSLRAGEGRQTYQSAGLAVARWVLEGDAPQETKRHE